MPLTVAVAGPTGDIGRAFPRASDHEPAVERVIGMARRPFDPPAAGLSSKIEYRQGDVPESDKLHAVFAGADVIGAPRSRFALVEQTSTQLPGVASGSRTYWVSGVADHRDSPVR